MRLKSVFGGIASILLAVVPAGAQQVNDVPYRQSPPLAEAPSAATLWRELTLPLLEDILEQRTQLELSPEQVESLQRLAVEFAREVIRRQADRQIAELDLATMIDPDPQDPAKPLDLGKVETKIREIERVGGDLELARLRAIEAGKALLSAEQRAKLGNLLTGDADPPDLLSVSLTAARSGGGAPGHPGGGGSRPPGGGGSRPPGGSPGHPPGGHPPGGSPGHPPGGHPPGGSPGHPPGWHARPPGHHPGYHPRYYGGIYVGGWPWYWWGYPGTVYTAPPPPPQSYWYYCPSYGAYYPDVLSCPESWVLVPAG